MSHRWKPEGAQRKTRDHAHYIRQKSTACVLLVILSQVYYWLILQVLLVLLSPLETSNLHLKTMKTKILVVSNYIVKVKP